MIKLDHKASVKSWKTLLKSKSLVTRPVRPEPDALFEQLENDISRAIATRRAMNLKSNAGSGAIPFIVSMIYWDNRSNLLRLTLSMEVVMRRRVVNLAAILKRPQTMASTRCCRELHEPRR